MRGLKIEVLIGISAIVLGLTLPVFAHAAVPDGLDARGKAMSLADTNKDGKVSEAEWKAATDMRFTQTDTNGDGVVSRDELDAERDKREAEMRKKRADAIFKSADQNSDGKLSKAEYETVSEKLYERMLKRKADGASSSERE